MTNSPFLILKEYEKTRTYTNSGTPAFKGIVPDEQFFSLDTPICLINTMTRECTGLASIFEYHVTRNGTVVFFTITRSVLSDKQLRAIYDVAMILNSDSRTMNQRMTSNISYSESAGRDMGTSTMDPAMAMSLGMDSDVRDVADRNRGKSHELSISEMMRMSGGYPEPDDD